MINDKLDKILNYLPFRDNSSGVSGKLLNKVTYFSKIFEVKENIRKTERNSKKENIKTQQNNLDN